MLPVGNDSALLRECLDSLAGQGDAVGELVVVDDSPGADLGPVEGATVLFLPTDHQYAAASKSDASGRFTLRTFDPNDGAAPGKFTVTVKKFEFLYPPGGGVETAGRCHSITKWFYNNLVLDEIRYIVKPRRAKAARSRYHGAPPYRR